MQLTNSFQSCGSSAVHISWHTSGHFHTNRALFECHSLSQPTVWLLTTYMTTIYSSYKGYFQNDYSPCLKAQVVSNWFHEHDNDFSVHSITFPVSWSESNRAPLWSNRQLTNLKESCDVMSTWTRISKEVFPKPCRTHAIKNWGCPEVLSSSSMVS